LVQVRGIREADLRDIFLKNFSIARNVLDAIPVVNGLDIYMFDKGAANRLVRELSKKYVLQVKRTSEDVGMTSRGKMRRRLIYSVKIIGKRKAK